MMRSFEGPLELPDLGWPIDKEVRCFAKSEELNIEPWHHDQPRWLLQREDGSITWSLQIAAFTVIFADKGPEDKLFFIPDVFRLDE